MRSLSVALAALVACAASVRAAGPDNSFYWFLPETDAPNHDISGDGGDVSTLARLCDADASCKGFNQDGYLKNCVDASCLQPSTTNLYIKKSVPMPPGLWPLPASVKGLDGTTLTMSSTAFKFSAASGSTDRLQRAFARYQGIVFNQRHPTPPTPPGLGPVPIQAGRAAAAAATASLDGITVSVKNTSAPLQMGADESYELVIPAAGGTATITAETTWGALHGLERFSQLVWWTGDGSDFVAYATTVQDSPRFSHRGLLVDTARHYLKMDALKMMIDTLGYNFYSVLHWHIVDDQSFPYESKTFPEMAAEGAFSPSHTYSQADVAEIIEYAADRAVRVLIEFDTPGHTRSWGISHPELLVPCYSGGKPNGDRYGVNPLLNSTFDFMSKFFGEVAEVFPDNYVHVGGDELSLGSGSCWTTNPDLQAWMKAHGKTDYAALENVYEQRFVKVVSATGKSIIGWQELFDNGIDLPDDFVVNVWKGGWQDEMSKVSQTYRTILSSPYYENYIKNPYGNSGDWRNYYTVDPLGWNGTAAQKARVMGCETSFWAEYIDAANIFSRVWPRASATGERFWSSADVNDADRALGRLRAHRCRMITRGIPAEPVEGPSYCNDEYDVVYTPPFAK